MVLGRMVYNFTASAKILGIKAWRFGLYFVLLDILLVFKNRVDNEQRRLTSLKCLPSTSCWSIVG